LRGIEVGRLLQDPKDTLSDVEVEEGFDRAIKNVLAMPPRPHKPKGPMESTNLRTPDRSEAGSRRVPLSCNLASGE